VDTDVWEAAGLYSPDAEGAAERAALLEHLTARGATLEQLVDAHRLGTLPAVAGDLVLGAVPPTRSLDDVARRTGVPVERVERVLLAAGLPVSAESRLPADLDAVIGAFEQGVALMGEDALLAFTRVLGAAATTIAEAAVALFYAEMGPGSLREGSDELARALMSERATLAFTTVPDALSRLLLAQFDRAAHRVALTRGWSAPSEADGDAPVDPDTAGPRELVTLGFVDLVDSTSWAERLSLRDQSLALSRFESAAWSSAVLAGGRVVKMIGDEVFFAAPSVDAACRIGIEVCRAAADDPVLPAARGAVGHGFVTPREGDFFGPLVNVVSRLVKAARPGALVLTGDAAADLPPGRWSLDELEPQELRGVDAPVRAFGVAVGGTDGA
jgi:adenylate cyclase